MPDIAAELEAVAGPLKGNSIPLTEAEISIGREPSNRISLLDAGVSRQHCLIRASVGSHCSDDSRDSETLAPKQGGSLSSNGRPKSTDETQDQPSSDLKET